MSYTKTIVCWANSRKWSGRCIAGKEWLDGRPGPWVRPVSTRPTHELGDDERCCQDGCDPELLDIVRIPCRAPQPQPHQRENHVIAAGRWVWQGRLAWGEVANWLDTPAVLWGLGPGSRAGLNNRVAVGRADGVSLLLIAVRSLRLFVGPRTPDDSKRAVRGEFSYRGRVYRLDVTDPAIEHRYLRQPDGQYEIADPVLCASLGDPFEGYYYKLLAAVLFPERFA
jgi:hypothetical protein